jgi:hypothetical protein
MLYLKYKLQISELPFHRHETRSFGSIYTTFLVEISVSLFSFHCLFISSICRLHIDWFLLHILYVQQATWIADCYWKVNRVIGSESPRAKLWLNGQIREFIIMFIYSIHNIQNIHGFVCITTNILHLYLAVGDQKVWVTLEGNGHLKYVKNLQIFAT